MTYFKLNISLFGLKIGLFGQIKISLDLDVTASCMLGIFIQRYVYEICLQTFVWCDFFGAYIQRNINWLDKVLVE